MQSVNLSLCTYRFVLNSSDLCEVTLAQVHLLREEVCVRDIAFSCGGLVFFFNKVVNKIFSSVLRGVV